MQIALKYKILKLAENFFILCYEVIFYMRYVSYGILFE